MNEPKSPYRRLQARAKARGIPANQSRAVLQTLLDEAEPPRTQECSEPVAQADHANVVQDSRVVILGVHPPPNPAQPVPDHHGAGWLCLFAVFFFASVR